jgi:hypothetical protein
MIIEEITHTCPYKIMVMINVVKIEILPRIERGVARLQNEGSCDFTI